MRINQLNSSPQFSSRNATIRFADNIARKINTVYPRISSTKYEGLGYQEFFTPNLKDLFLSIECMRMRISDRISRSSLKFVDCAKIRTQEILKSKVGNCHESAMLGELGAKINGLPNCYIAELKSGSENNVSRMDHAVLYVDSVRNPYIIDPWLGFADYVPNTIERYKKEFSNFFDDKSLENKMFFEILQPKNKLSKDELSELKKEFPQLII